MNAQIIRLQVIYKLTQTGAIQSWCAQVCEDSWRTIHGQVDGKKTVSEWTKCLPTNAGRSNARTAAQQALFEAQAEYKYKLKRDYHETLEAARAVGAKYFKPMLAEKYEDAKGKHAVAFPIWSQPKLDGMRCITNAKGMWSREGEPIRSAPHIFEQLKPLFKDDPNLVLDGELYNHDLKHDFNSLISMLKKTKMLTKEVLDKSKELIEYHVYDIPCWGFVDEEPSFGERYGVLCDLLYNNKKTPSIVLVETITCRTQGNLDSSYEHYLEQGYEGQMIRKDANYENKRTWSLLKRKEMQTEEFELLSIHGGNGNWSGKARFAWLKTKKGVKFKADIVGTMAFCAKVHKEQEKYLGKPTTVKFQNYTPDGKPRFGKIKELGRRG
jgi:DNA ligase-1